MPFVINMDGFTFGGWYKEAALLNQWNFNDDIVTSNITLYAKWIENFTVTFEANGGSLVPTHQSITPNGKITELPSINMDGFTFGGWYKEESFINRWNFSTDIVTSNITLYAKWLENFKVIFEANGGTPVPDQQTLIIGQKINKPIIINKIGFNFEGWYKDIEYLNIWDFNNDTISSDIILFAKWGPPIIVNGVSFSTKIRWLEANAQSGGSYIVEVDANQSGQLLLSYNEKNNINIILNGNETNPIISGDIIIRSGVTLTLNNNLTVSFVEINSDGNLILNHGARINRGVTVRSGGNFSMNGGEIISNSSYQNAGVLVDINGIFTLNEGKIISTRGGVRVEGTFIMNDGEISGSNNYMYGGVQVIGTFIMNGGKVYDNTSTLRGGGVFIGSSGNFIMNDGIISGNTVYSLSYDAGTSSSPYTPFSQGGGVYVEGAFTMNGGEISDNISTKHPNQPIFNSNNYFGGGVFVQTGIFTLNAGKIYKNTANRGGGVYVRTNGRIIMNGGEIFNNNSGGVFSDNGSITMVAGKVFDNSGIGINTSGIFIMSGGEIYNNSSRGVSTSGNFTMSNGKIYNNSSGGVSTTNIFTINGGEIFGNYSNTGGSGVLIETSSNFNKTGGIIYGFTENDNNSNVVRDNSGVVLNNKGHAIHINHSNTIYIMGKDTTSGTTDNLSFNGNVNPPAWSGVWDY